jgi:hypothetical protein
MHLYRPIVLAGAVFGALALFLPFATLPVIGAIDGIAGDGWPALIVAGPVVAKAALGDWSRGNQPFVGITLTVMGCLATVVAAVKLADAVGAVRGLDGAALGPGAPLLVGSMALVAAGAAFSLRRP